ncbi:PrsW family intramembrane metalloprotease [Actinoplanes sp. NEAU-A12]|uniref:PrsW family intramembrane metalloprotease n=1 Tax=Actinoplanes sandaracinus TaxID=3045177 RepID=A0ABT6WSX4_9ACTN|nr:PrsW family intramembrane metalloprotease [Actinoplanes sandaracinus]MDI6102834.1 PrsW family intramembrane metalloprotease [Actinoplanes sandaracinus]
MSEAVRPGATRAAVLLRQPAFWIVITLLAAGAVRISQITALFLETYPIATITAILLFGLLAVPFWLFLSELDFLEREPPSLRILAFAWGGLVATSVSIPGSAALDNLIAKLGSPDLAAEWGAALAGPTVEEIAKTLGVVAIVLIARAQVNSVLDGIVYGALVGLGFQIVEDVVFAIGAVQLAGEGDQVRPVITTFLVRGFLAGVWSHTLFGALAGAGIGYLVVHRDRTRSHRIAVAVLAVLAAWASHSLWNSPLFRESLGDATMALLAVLIFKGLPPLLLVLYLVRRAHDREAAYYVGVLATVRDPGLITENELRILGSGSRRGAARRHAAAHAGRRARAAVRRLQRAQAGLAVELSRASADVPDDSVEARAAEVREHRATLAALGHPEAVEGTRSWRHTASTVGTAAVAVAVVWVALSALGGD